MIISPTLADLDTIKVPSPRINLKRDHFTRKIVFPAAFVSGDILVFGGVIKVTIDYNAENPTQKKTWQLAVTYMNISLMSFTACLAPRWYG